MAGLLIVEDDEAKGNLPSGANDLPFVLQDRQIDSNGQFIYNPNAMTGFLGDLIFVNGKPTPTFNVKAGTYRLRLLNGSNARIYKLGWSDGSAMVVIGSDGGLLQAPVRKPYVMLAPGERVEIWADFGKAPVGPDVWLESRSFVGGTGGMMGMMGMGGGMGRGMAMGMPGASGGPPNGSRFRVCRFVVTGTGERLPLPRTLSRLQFRPDREVVNLGNPRRFDVTMAMMRWTLNGRTFGMDDLAPNERIRKGTTEDWEFSNLVGMMAMPHPIHIHGGQFQIVDRAVAPGAGPAVDSVREGRVEEGWKDTFLLMPGERARVRVRFEHHAGLFLYHCHNLEHEDMGMMRNFRVEV
jgi:FtsP/CotA-like multicopper oxidase with cupredoxin domain